VASAFEIYLRTGRRVGGEVIPVETKFNPWHDPDDGRFTFAGQGRCFPGRTVTRRRTGNGDFSGGGGSFGGGGAGGSWGDNRGSSGNAGPPGRWRSPNHEETAPSILSKVEGVVPGRPHAGAVRQETGLALRQNGFDFLIDAHARPRRVSGELRLQPQPRSRSAQANAGKPDRRPTDDGGHFIAARFNGPREWFNHFAQDANFNRGAYRALEDRWAKTIRSGRRVFVDIVPHYKGESMRPYKIVVRWSAGRGEVIEEFPNERRGR